MPKKDMYKENIRFLRDSCFVYSRVLNDPGTASLLRERMESVIKKADGYLILFRFSPDRGQTLVYDSKVVRTMLDIFRRKVMTKVYLIDSVGGGAVLLGKEYRLVTIKERTLVSEHDFAVLGMASSKIERMKELPNEVAVREGRALLKSKYGIDF